MPDLEAPGTPLGFPARLTPLVGRGRELAELHIRLRLPEVRLLTLTGSGGSGKTRLALAVADELRDAFQNQVFFVDLAPVSDAVLVPSAIASALRIRTASPVSDAGIAENVEPSAENSALLRSLIDRIQDRRQLLVLDNFEHVLPASTHVAALLEACPRLKILVTSRSPLRLDGEYEFPVPLLAVPDPVKLPPVNELPRFEAIALFLQRAQAVKPDFALTEANAPAVVAICQMVDGLPLAIELAAARIRLLPPQALLTRLSDPLALLTGGGRNLPTRQQTLRATLDWSYDLLSPEEQRLFSRLAVLVRSWTLEAAEAVAGSDGDTAQTLEILASLLDKSLLRQEDTAEGEARFSMLATIREYALERLESTGEAPAARQRHASYFLALAEEAAPRLRGPRQAEWLARLERDHDNLRLALRWALQAGEAEMAVRLGAALWRFWWFLGHLGESRRWLEGLLDDSRSISPAVRAQALSGTFAVLPHALAADPTSYLKATEFFTESLALCRELGDARGVALSLGNLGQIAVEQGDVERGIPLLEESLALLRELGDRERIARALHSLGTAALLAQQNERAEEALRESLAIRRELGDRPGVVASLTTLARAAAARSDDQAASAFLGEALRFARDVGANPVVAQAIDELGRRALAAGRSEQAARLFGAAETVRAAAGALPSTLAQRALERDLTAIRAALGDPSFSAAMTAGDALGREELIEQALATLAELTPSPAPALPVRPPDPAYPLTAREREVAALIARGKTNREISDALVIAEGTTERHVANILNKLNLHSRSQIAVWAAEHGLLSGPTA